MTKKQFTLKSPDVQPKELQEMQFALGIVLHYIVGYAELHSLPLDITSITEYLPDRVSKGHEEGRMLDFSLRGWPEQRSNDLALKVNSVFQAWATGPINKPKTVMIIHNIGRGNHGHVQVKRGITLDDIGTKKIFGLE